jgi:SAM-dependent methyltransferase
MERHRTLAALFLTLPESRRPGACLDVAPLNPAVYGRWLRRQGWAYVGVDKWRKGNPSDPREVSFIDFEADVVDMRIFRDGQFDLVIMQHVLEEVPDYRKGIAEIARVLKPTGVALLEIPYNKHVPETQPAPANRYGNVWSFGADLADAMRERLPRVEVLPMQWGAYSSEVFVCRHAHE